MIDISANPEGTPRAPAGDTDHPTLHGMPPYESAVVGTDSRLLSGIVSDAMAHWQALRGERAMPARSDLDPAAITPLLPYLYLVDVLGNGADFRYRLIGTDIVRNTIRDNTGARLSDLRGQGSQARLAQLYADCLASRAPRSQLFPYTRRSGEVAWYETAVAPLSPDGSSITMLLGVAEHFMRRPRPTIGMGR